MSRPWYNTPTTEQFWNENKTRTLHWWRSSGVFAYGVLNQEELDIKNKVKKKKKKR